LDVSFDVNKHLEPQIGSHKVDKTDKLIAQIRKELDRKPTNELNDIWIENNQKVWNDEAFEAIRQILLDRKENLPTQKPIQKNYVVLNLGMTRL
jgi:hypothetical protein